MGFFSDLFEGNFGNLWHDITADPVAEIGLGTAALLGTGGLLAPELLSGAAGGLGSIFGFGGGAADVAGGAGGGLGGLFGGGAADVAGGAGSALGAETSAAAGTDITALLSGPGGTASNALAFSPETTAGLPAEITTGASAGTGTNDALIQQILNTEKGFVSGLPDSSGGGGNIFSNLISGAGNQITKNPLGVAAGGAGLVGSLLQGNKSSGPAQNALTAEAPVLQQQGNILQSYLQSGTLPPALQAQLDQQIQADKARIISNHAAQGRPTDPSQNSALAQELNNVDMQALAAKGQTEAQLYQQGLADIQLSTQLMTTLATFDRQDQQAVTQALMNFAKAMSPATFTIAPGTGGAQVKLS
jgi:hypothetical protein